MLLNANHIASDPVQKVNADGASSIVLVCEHASRFIPKEFKNLGLPEHLRDSHVVWDPGALGVARRMSQRLDAALVAGGVSRLVYDCNRPPEAIDAMPAQSEVITIPGNIGLTSPSRKARTQAFYAPFRDALAQQIDRTDAPVIVTIHSFTPVYHGTARAVEIGVLHDEDTRLADAMLHTAAAHTQANVQRNQPYGPDDGVTHTLREHAIEKGHLNVMLEVRNDLIRTEAAQTEMGDMLAVWLAAAFATTQSKGAVTCVA